MKPFDMNRSCPTCKNAVFGFRTTKRYCNDSCRAKHHYIARKQLELRLSEEILLSYHQLITRNLYLAEGLIGSKFSKVQISIKELKMHKFQFSEAFQTVVDEGINKYKLCNYLYWQEGEVVHIERIGEVPEYGCSVEERWLEEYPLLAIREDISAKSRLNFKKFALKSGYAWRE